MAKGSKNGDALDRLRSAERKLNKICSVLEPILSKTEELRLVELRNLHAAANGLAEKLAQSIKQMEACFNNRVGAAAQ